MTAKSKKPTTAAAGSRKGGKPKVKNIAKKKLAIFIDGNNFRNGLQAFIKSENIDWKNFLASFGGEYKLVSTHYYIGRLTHPLFEEEQVEEQDKLFAELKKAKVETFQGYFNEEKHEKGVDVQIALDIAVGAIEKKFEVALLISGDGDLSNSLIIARKKKVKIILGYISGIKSRRYRVSWILKSITDSQMALNKQIKAAHEEWKKKNSKALNSKSESKKPKTAKPKAIKSESETLPPLLLFTDGGSRGNPGPAGCGVVITDQDGKVLEKTGKYIGKTTNNQAEYQALLLGLKTIEKAIGKNKIEEIRCYLDSKLIVEQVNGRWKVKKKELKPHYEKVKLFLLKHPNTSFHHIPREKNKLADEMANKAMDRGR